MDVMREDRICKACVQSQHETRLCHACKRKKNMYAYHKTEWRNDIGRKCRACINKEMDNHPQPGKWKCYGQCGGRALPHACFSVFRDKNTGKRRCDECVQTHDKDVDAQQKQCNSEVTTAASGDNLAIVMHGRIFNHAVSGSIYTLQPYSSTVFAGLR